MATEQSVDVVDFLKSQHREVESLLDQVEKGTGEGQKDAFQCLVRLLAVHETAEEEVVHPLAKQANGGQPIVDSRLSEESEAKEVLAGLEKLDVGSSEFNQKFSSFASDVRSHASHEEQEEFPLITASNEPEQRERLAKMVEMAEKTAPTHPHPHGPDSAVGNLLVGPFASIADRVKDALRGKSA